MKLRARHSYAAGAWLAAALLWATGSGWAATLTFSTTAPTPGPNDIYNFAGASHDGANVGNGSAFADGQANDSFTYVAGDRPDQGQTFTTGNNPAGYAISSVWLQHAGYTANTALTYWEMNGGVPLTLRVTDPAKASTAGFVLYSETDTTTGTEGWSGAHSSDNGDGMWLQFTFTNAFPLAPGKTYGFDVSSPTVTAFFEWLGTSNDVYAGGAAYNGSTLGENGGPDNACNRLAGDRVFLVRLGPPPPPLLAQATVQGTNLEISFNSNPTKYYVVQYAASLAPANWENLFPIPVPATNSLMSYLQQGGAMAPAGFYRIAQFDALPLGINLGPLATPATSYVSSWQTLGVINSGYNPSSAADASQGAYGNWPETGTQWVEYDWSQPIQTARVDVYWWEDGAGISAPSSCSLEYRDGTNWDAVGNPVGLGVASNQYNTTTFAPVTTTALRLWFTSAGTQSTGILQWKVYDTGASANFPPIVVGDVDREVVAGGTTYLTGTVQDDAKLYLSPVVTWSLASGPNPVTFSNASASVTRATVGGPAGPAVLQLTAFDGQYYSSNTLKLTVAAPFPAAHALPVYVEKNSYTITSSLWSYRLKNTLIHWIPHLYSQLNNTNLAQGNINSFIQAGNKLAGRSYTVPNVDPWADAYTLNTVEAMSYALLYDAQGDPAILAAQAAFQTNLAYWIPQILSAQESDGYLHTYTTLRGLGRWTINTDHEGYVGGYFIEAGLAHYLSTGRTDPTLYNAAKKLADCWCAHLGPGVKIWFDGHENMEQALVHLGRFVNEFEGPTNGQKYIALAKFLLDCRGTPAANAAENDGADYDQSQSPVAQQYEVVGHAVRSQYLCSGLADAAMETKSLDDESAALSLFDNFVNKKYYVTGGAGSGETAEGFGQNYSLPNASYCETCAGCGTLFFFHKLNLAYQDAKYADLMENVLYNEVLGSLDDQASNIFYPNPLNSSAARAAWTGVPCCYGNAARTLFQLPTWIYARSSNAIYLNLFVGGSVTISNISGATVTLVQATDYPWTNTVGLTVNPSAPANFALFIREPNRTMSALYAPAPAIRGLASLLLNGSPISPEVTNGYAVINRSWTAGDRVDLALPMAIQRIRCSTNVAANAGLVALQYGPLLYNIESVDQDISLVLGSNAPLSLQHTNLLGGFWEITGAYTNGSPLLAIPNYARLNRGGSSSVWFSGQ
ncbi:MAG TPA: beta-L-arabinofuranosidase domain-containing protein [Candidatus Acidoferrum sp.]|nr:beta-L-arabinofuranosidase domain-containing protein [Candidatus Acidoferrum sp.]